MSLSICSLIGVNTGGIDCDRKMGTPIKLIVGSGSIASADWATSADMLAAFQALIHKAAGVSDKLFPFPTIQGNTDQTEADTEGTLGYGLKFKIREGRPAYEFQVLAGHTQYQRLRKFNNTVLPVFVMDEAAIWGKIDTAGKFAGMLANIYVSGNGFEDQNSVERKAAKITISFVSASEFYDKSVYQEIDFSESDLKGLVDAKASLVGVVSANTKFKFEVDTARLNTKLNLADYFADVMDDAAMYDSTLAITGVTYNAATKDFTFAFNSTAYTALASGDAITVGLKAPATLYAAGIVGVEGISVTVVKP